MEKKPRILIVDDDADFVDLAKTVLTRKPYQVLVAYSGEEALQRVAKEKPDLIILDIIMPVKDGFTVCEQLKKNPETAKIPVIMLTGFRQHVGETTLAAAQGLMLEAEDYIEKPLDAAELLRRVEHHLKKLGL